MRKMHIWVSTLSILLASSVASATQWQINNNESQVNFISTKKVNIAEVHQFDKIAGNLAETGEFSLAIDLASVNTGIEIRDSRMKEFLFNVADFPKATITAQLSPEQIAQITVGQTKPLSIDGFFELHGQKQEMTFDVLVTKVTENELLVVSSHPVILSVDDYKLAQGVEKLRDLAGLPNISHAVPVSFYLTLNATN
ncbi:YceI family protein [Methylophaga sp. UBA5088]|uniref:YceI family protein n=1 Tax=Methylophaga sp. UBA5088 TaxID=1946898 RepID=UPI00259CE073|nr:YceI family protein [Methylophaga sp. UBA5088]